MSQSLQRDIGRVLVVGGSGRLGQLLRRAWAYLGQDGLIWQHRREGPMIFDPLHEPEKFTAAATGADTILNLAGVTGSDRSALALNTDLALAAVRAAKAASVKRVFLASSAAVYGSTSAGYEADLLSPPTAYGQAKLDMEMAAIRWVKTNGGPGVTCLRIGNVAGADQLLGAMPDGDGQALDLFSDGRGPARSYVGPIALAQILSDLFSVGLVRKVLPQALNVALEGTVGMDTLLDVDNRRWVARGAPDATAREVCLDVSGLAQLVPVERADARRIVADFRTLVPRVRS